MGGDMDDSTRAGSSDAPSGSEGVPDSQPFEKSSAGEEVSQRGKRWEGVPGAYRFGPGRGYSRPSK